MMSFTPSKPTIYSYTVKDINGNNFSMSKLKGKKIMIVNVASKCMYTPQYTDLENLYKTYGGKDFEIIAFPSNDFFHQEPGSNEEIKKFCTLNYNVSFNIMTKISVKGKKKAPIYQWLTEKKLNGYADSRVRWNFQKYLIDEHGHLVHVFKPRVKPNDKRIIAWIKGAKF